MICDNEAAKGSVIIVMPDVHPGKVGPIGLTMIVGERVLPSLVGIDIGCGMLAIKLGIILGNEEWNYSAPRGSGRIASREKVLQNHTVSEFKAEMKGVYTSCISKDTLEEAPFAYRRTDYIREAVKDTVKVEKIITPVYNYKGGNAK